MKIIVVGGSGLIGRRLIPMLRDQGHDAQPASPSTGVNTLSGQGLDEALNGATVVIDVSNSPSFEEDDVMQFFTVSTRNLLAAEARAGVTHHVALSVVGADRIRDSAYMRAKVAQEKLIQSSPIPFTILRATQFFEFLGTIADQSTADRVIRLPSAPMQPVAANDVAETLADIATGPAANRICDLAGPESLSIAEFIERYLLSNGDNRTVIRDDHSGYFGAHLDQLGLIPETTERIGRTNFDEWQNRQTKLEFATK